jgi:hypothetical protein
MANRMAGNMNRLIGLRFIRGISRDTESGKSAKETSKSEMRSKPHPRSELCIEFLDEVMVFINES